MYEGNDRSAMIDIDDFIKLTYDHWCFGWDDTGDVTCVKNINSFIDAFENSKMLKIHLVNELYNSFLSF